MQVDIEPASIDRIRIAADGQMVEVSAESSQVAADLAAIDPGLKVRFSERGECYFVRHDWHPGCAHNGDVGEGGGYLVLTVKAFRAASGIWTGLDQRVVDRFRLIDPHGRSGYDYVRELERGRERVERDRDREFEERIGETAERTAHALRTDLGLGPYKGRVFLPREV